VSESGFIEGRVEVTNIVMNGTVNGDMCARERLVLGGKARVNGNVYYGVIEMAPGAVITGKLIPLANGAAKSPETQAEAGPAVAAAKPGA
jgi:cytoskeletal protein CcmA (bactofilin family)